MTKIPGSGLCLLAGSHHICLYMSVEVSITMTPPVDDIDLTKYRGFRISHKVQHVMSVLDELHVCITVLVTSRVTLVAGK